MTTQQLIKLLLKLFLGGIVLFTLILVMDSRAFDEIPPKGKPSHLRIGYANMYMRPFTLVEEEMYMEADCDLWLILEWTGENVSSEFREKYEIVDELVKRNPHGFVVFAKKGLDIKAKTRNKSNPNYACNFPFVEMEVNGIHIDFVHAPPPIPTCEFKTAEFIEFLLGEIRGPNMDNAVIVGDFNTMPFQNSIKKIKDLGYKDVFSTKGIFNGTYSGVSFFPNLIRLDYAFTKGDLEVPFATRLRLRNSDHSGLIFDLEN